MEEPLGDGTIVVVPADDFEGIAPLADSARAFEVLARPVGDAWLGELRGWRR